MSDRPSSPPLPEPRLLVVLAGAATVRTRTPTALERASVPNLAALAAAGRTGRLRAVAPHLPADAASAHATLLGAALPEALDLGAVAAHAAGVELGPSERCTLIEVLDHAGDVAPALHVAHAVEVLRSQLPTHRVASVRRGNELLLVGPGTPEVPEAGGLELRVTPPGYLPERPPLDESTVVVATAGSTILGVAELLGAAIVPVEATRAGRHDPVPARLRTAATRALLSGARTVVVESAAPLVARRGHREEPVRERAVAQVLGRLDRELLGPLIAAAAWRRASFIVTADIARRSAGPPVAGDVPVIVAGDRDLGAVGTPRRVALADGVVPPPAHSERGVAGRPIVTSPFLPPPARDPEAPLRFTRDPSTGVTLPDLAAS